MGELDEEDFSAECLCLFLASPVGLLLLILFWGGGAVGTTSYTSFLRGPYAHGGGVKIVTAECISGGINFIRLGRVSKGGGSGGVKSLVWLEDPVDSSVL